MKTETTTTKKAMSAMDFKMLFTGFLIVGFFIEIAKVAIFG
jgi:hypothetical protein